MKSLAKFLIALTFSLISLAQVVFADTIEYSDAEFNTALKTEGAVVLDFHADWCPTCRAQAKAFKVLLKEEKFKPLTLFKVDYDNADDLKQKYGVSRQSTLILFKNGKEVDRNISVTDIDELRAFFSKGL